MFVKIIKTYRNIVAVCDANLLGKRFEEGEFQLDVKENFFKGQKTHEEELIEIIRDAASGDATFNIIGEKSVNTALKSGIISDESVRKIQGIPFIIILN